MRGRNKEDNKERMKVKFQAAQAALPPEQRLGHEDRDWEEHVFRQWSLAHEAAIASTREAFFDFLTDEDYSVGLAPEEAMKYFQKDGTPATTKILRRWLECEAYRRPGRKQDSKLHFQTLHKHLGKLNTVFKRAQNPVDKLIVEGAHCWIDAALVPKDLLEVQSPTKQVAISADLSLLRQTLFSVDYLATFADCRSPLQFALFLTLVVDCEGRAGELIASSNKKTDNNKNLKWSQVSFYAVSTSAGVTIRANIKFDSLKSDKLDPSKHKTTPLRLLPLSLAGEDSLRMLLVLAFIDGIFENLTCWDDIQKLCPGPDGSKIFVKPAALRLPVFRTIRNNQVTDEPLRYWWIATELIRLSQRLGLQQHLICTTLRRGAAYLLAMNVSKEERCARMGHSDSDTTYWSHYRNEISTIDFQAIVHGVEAEDMTMHSSITLGRAQNAPTRLSENGYQGMARDPHLQALRQKSLEALDAMLEAHGSTKNAKKINSADYHLYSAAERAYDVARQAYVKAAFARELKEFFQQDLSMLQQCHDDSEDSSPKSKERCDGGSNVALDKALPSTHDEMAMPDFSAAHEAAIANDELALIDSGKGISMDDLDIENMLAVVEADSATPAKRLEIDSVISGEGLSMKIRQTQRTKTITMPVTLLDSVSEELLRFETELTDAQLANLMVSSFSNMFPSDSFFPGQEPLPGTNKCQFCNKDLLLDNGHRATHALFCQKKAILQEIIDTVDSEYQAPATCSWVGNGPRTLGKICSADTAKSPASHLTNHVRGGVECRFGACGLGVKSMMFKGNAELLRHIWIEHNILCTQAIGHRRVEAFIWWCSTCFKWINGLHEDLNQHVRKHIHLINDIIHHDGYKGMTIYDINFRPRYCPFCLHNADLPETGRFADFYSGTDSYSRHLLSHIKTLSEAKALCPATISTDDGITANCSCLESMSSEELKDHLTKHHIQLSVSEGKREETDMTEETRTTELSLPARKRRNIGRRGLLQPKPLNIGISQAIKAGKSTTKVNEEINAVDLQDVAKDNDIATVIDPQLTAGSIVKDIISYTS